MHSHGALSLQAKNRSLRAERDALAAEKASLQEEQQAARGAAAQRDKEKEGFQQVKASRVSQRTATPAQERLCVAQTKRKALFVHRERLSRQSSLAHINVRCQQPGNTSLCMKR